MTSSETLRDAGYHFFKEGDEVVRPNEDGMPRLRVSKYYQRAASGLTPKEREYVIDRLRRAEWVTKCILQRQSTIRKVCESILRFKVSSSSADRSTSNRWSYVMSQMTSRHTNRRSQG